MDQDRRCSCPEPVISLWEFIPGVCLLLHKIMMDHRRLALETAHPTQRGLVKETKIELLHLSLSLSLCVCVCVRERERERERENILT